MVVRAYLVIAILALFIKVGNAQGALNDTRIGCRQALNQRLARENRGATIRTKLRAVQERGGGVQLRLSGEAEVSIDSGPWRVVSFECIYNLRGDYAESASYTYTDTFSGGGWNNGGDVSGGEPVRPRPGGRGVNFDALPGFTMRRGGRGGNLIELKVQVDGMVDIFIRDDQLRFDVINGQPPSDLGTVAGVFLPRRSLECLVERRDGRAEILIIDQPTRQNNFTLHLQINDRAGGSDKYEARITW